MQHCGHFDTKNVHVVLPFPVEFSTASMAGFQLLPLLLDKEVCSYLSKRGLIQHLDLLQDTKSVSKKPHSPVGQF